MEAAPALVDDDLAASNLINAIYVVCSSSCGSCGGKLHVCRAVLAILVQSSLFLCSSTIKLGSHMLNLLNIKLNIAQALPTREVVLMVHGVHTCAFRKTICFLTALAAAGADAASALRQSRWCSWQLSRHMAVNGHMGVCTHGCTQQTLNHSPIWLV